ncbi:MULTISPECIES: ABC transporter ATP-binding protein [unclassified Cryobacterium]|uniref:dipeptide ABC transporter ATP-binding protein n=1 Tax=unclassified Cryobacterium TaxID=2649013 RepID=UPI00106C8D14|nr:MULTISPECIES: ABC transporter ATP-binding protein [unclassified Cryobacterium]TFC55521.1 ABC transporter ATP-binding protein [Cryobacterium sp. TMB3-1-2]TFC72923.1 ABC transporter ATP-binding protein [Cryobacterium sp. TMB3-15]TFC76429.1 ABC transporter ATP-binding protein [Cryobacterium sp. TMB3-10]TFD43644.1 ABC transporter ATP-binding protein [Cryobacterium sp. TMB3-12]
MSATDSRSAGPHPAVALRVRNLRVGFGDASAADVVRGVSFELRAGECLAIVGESGSGKSVTARSILGLAGTSARVSADELSLAGESVLGLSEAAWRRRRGRDVGLVLQDALASLDPLRPIIREIGDSLRLHTRLDQTERSRKVLEILAAAGLAQPELYAGRRSGELSGGQRQRALIAAALALDPPLLVADEPTTALDVTVQAQVLDLLEQVRGRGTAIVLISHDLAVVSRIADRIAVMHEGRIIETGTTAEVLQNPRHAETRRMLAAVPVDRPRGSRLAPATAVREPVVANPPARVPERIPVSVASRTPPVESVAEPVIALEAIGLSKSFRGPHGTMHRAVDEVSFRLPGGSTLGIVGESGSGKTTTARLALALTAADTGEVRLLGEAWSTLPERDRRARRPLVGAVYQDVLGSFDPRLSVREILRHAVAATAGSSTGGGSAGRRATAARVSALLDDVGLAETLLDRRPTDLSGGQRQRVGIARALASSPRILICDEPVSALDVSVQAQVLDLLDELQRELSLSLLFISHDLGVIQHVSDHVAVMNDGRIVETGTAAEVFTRPAHPYTRALLAAVPRLA